MKTTGDDTGNSDETMNNETEQDTPESITEDTSEMSQADAEEAIADNIQDASSADETPQKSGGSKKLLLFLIAAGVIGAGGWYGWQQLQSVKDDPTVAATTAAGSPPSSIAPEPGISTSLAEGNVIERATIADIDDVKSDIRSLSGKIDNLAAELESARSDLTQQERETRQLKETFQNRVDLLDSLPGRVRNNEEALVTIKGISAGSRNAWLMAEAEYYLQIANAQIQLANNPPLAAAALELADERVRELADPAYVAVRRSIAEELVTLRSINSSDIEGVTLTLGSLASMVPALPLRRDQLREPESATTGTEDLHGWARAKRATGNFFSGMFTYRKAEESAKPLLSPEAEYFLRQNLGLQLQAARLSLLLGESAAYRQSIEDAGVWLDEYFDTNDAGVTAAIEMLAGVRDVTMVDERPDISGSLTLLRQIRDIGATGAASE